MGGPYFCGGTGLMMARPMFTKERPQRRRLRGPRPPAGAGAHACAPRPPADAGADVDQHAVAAHAADLCHRLHDLLHAVARERAIAALHALAAANLVLAGVAGARARGGCGRATCP
jgi:hypothetical protein